MTPRPRHWLDVVLEILLIPLLPLAWLLWRFVWMPHEREKLYRKYLHMAGDISVLCAVGKEPKSDFE